MSINLLSAYVLQYIGKNLRKWNYLNFIISSKHILISCEELTERRKKKEINYLRLLLEKYPNEKWNWKNVLKKFSNNEICRLMVNIKSSVALSQFKCIFADDDPRVMYDRWLYRWILDVRRYKKTITSNKYFPIFEFPNFIQKMFDKEIMKLRKLSLFSKLNYKVERIVKRKKINVVNAKLINVTVDGYFISYPGLLQSYLEICSLNHTRIDFDKDITEDLASTLYHRRTTIEYDDDFHRGFPRFRITNILEKFHTEKDIMKIFYEYHNQNLDQCLQVQYDIENIIKYTTHGPRLAYEYPQYLKYIIEKYA